MAGRGPARKVGERLGHGTKPPQTISAAPTPLRPLPPGEWTGNAEDWWRTAASSAVAPLWAEDDWDKCYRLLFMVDRWWRLMGEGKDSTAVALHAEIRRTESLLYLSMVDRARAGLKAQAPEPAQAAPSASSDAKSRLRALG